MRSLLSLYIWVHSRWQTITRPKFSRYSLRDLKHHSKQLEQVLRRMHAYEYEIEGVSNLDQRLAIAAKTESLHQVAVSLSKLINEDGGE